MPCRQKAIEPFRYIYHLGFHINIRTQEHVDKCICGKGNLMWTLIMDGSWEKFE